jgi:hypothetical protein
MEQSATQKNGTNLYLLFAGIVSIILLIVGYFTFFAKSAIPQTFFLQYQKQHILATEVQSTMQFNYGLIGEQIQAKNASEAATLAKQGLVQSLQNKKKAEAVNERSDQLKVLLASISDTTLREKVIKLFSLLDDRNKRIVTLIDTQISIFTSLRNHFGAVSVGGKGSDIPQNIDAVIQATQKEIQAIVQLQTNIDIAYEEIVQLAGNKEDISVLEKTNLLKMSLSPTLGEQITITDFPTPTPAPTIAATPTSSASAIPISTTSAN